MSDKVILAGAGSPQSSAPTSLFTIADPAEEEAQVQVQGLAVTHTTVNLAAVTLKAPH